ncbi:hypothetical protein ACEU6E_01805 [Halorutilales archaeon Cl-col2-1]
MSRSLSVSFSGSILVSGGLNVGKTRLTAETLVRYADKYPEAETVLLDFAPELMKDGDLVGGHVSRFVDVPETVSEYVLEANAPRLESDTEDGAVELARENHDKGVGLVESAPHDPDAVFVNDATIPFQYPDSDSGTLVEYCERADDCLLNVYDPRSGGDTETVLSDSGVLNSPEAATVESLRGWADVEIHL